MKIILIRGSDNMKNKQWFCQDCRVLMIFHPKEKVHVCPKCKTKVFPNDEDADRKLNNEIYSLMADMAPTHRQTEVKPSGPFILGGGSKSSKKKAKSTKPSLAELNNKLYESR